MNEKNSNLQIRFFSDDQVKTIHANAMDILETHGFMVEHRGALEMLRQSGAQVDFDKQVVKVKSDMVEKCIRATPSQFVLGARDPARDVCVETDMQFPVCRNGGGVDKIIDLDSGEFRNMLLADVTGLYLEGNIGLNAVLYKNWQFGGQVDLTTFAFDVEELGYSNMVNYVTFSLGLTVFLDVIPPEVRASHLAEQDHR